MKKPSNPATRQIKELGNLFQTIRKARIQGRGGPISPEAVRSIGMLFDTAKQLTKAPRKAAEAMQAHTKKKS